jgi:hypothetical protein
MRIGSVIIPKEVKGYVFDSEEDWKSHVGELGGWGYQALEETVPPAFPALVIVGSKMGGPSWGQCKLRNHDIYHKSENDWVFWRSIET